MLFSQEIEQLTFHEDFGFEDNYVNYYEYQGGGLFFYHTLDDYVVCKQIVNGELKTIYSSSFKLCEAGYLEWYAFENKIIFLGLEGLYLEDIFTGDFVTEEFDIGTDYQLREFYDFQFDHGRATVSVDQDTSFVYDMILEQKVPGIEGAILFRTANYLYFNNGTSFDRNFIRKEHASPVEDTLRSGFRAWRVNNLGKNHLIHIKDEVLFRVDMQTDEIIDLGTFEGSMIASFQSEENVISAVTSTGEDALLTSFKDDVVIAERALSTGSNTTLSSDFDGNYLLLRKNVGFLSSAYIYDLSDDSLTPLEEDVTSVDFFDTKDYTILLTYEFDYLSYFLVNKRDKTRKRISIKHPLTTNNSEVIVKDDQGNEFIQSFDEKSGALTYGIDPFTDSLSAIQLEFKDNYGIGTNVQKSGDLLFAVDEDQDSTYLLIVDETMTSGIQEIAIETNGFGIINYEGRFAYFAENKGKRTSTNRYYDIHVKEVGSSDFVKVVEDFEVVQFVSGFDYTAYGRHMIISNQDGHMAFDLRGNLFYPVSGDGKLFLELARRELEDYYIVDITIVGGSGRLVLQSKNDLNVFKDINTKSPKYLPVKGNEFVYYTFTEAYFHNSEDEFLLGTAEEGVNIHEISVSENKEFVLFNSSVGTDRAINVYETATNMKKQYILPRFSWVEMDSRKLLIYSFDADGYMLEVINIDTDDSNVLEFDYLPVLLSSFGKEFHFYDRPAEMIRVYDESLNLLESVPNRDAKDIVLIPVDERKDVEPMISFAYVNRNQVFNSVVRTDAFLSIYNAAERSFDFFFSCDHEASLLEVVKTGDEIYSLAGTAQDGYQIYVLELDDYIVNTSKTVVEDFKIFPNPVSDLLYVSSALSGFTIYDVLGNIVDQSFETTQQVNVNRLNAGVYFIKENNAQNSALKFVKVGLK